MSELAHVLEDGVAVALDVLVVLDAVLRLLQQVAQ